MKVPDVKVDVTVELDVQVWCAECGNGICNQADVEQGKRNGEVKVHVKPCPHCLELAEQVGYDRGLDEGRSEEKP